MYTGCIYCHIQQAPISEEENDLWQSILNGSLESFIDALSKYEGDLRNEIPNMKNTEDHEEVTLLIEASRCGHTEIVNHLLEKYSNIINVNATGTVIVDKRRPYFSYPIDFQEYLKKVTALSVAAEFGYLKIVKLLIKYGATIDCMNNTKSTALYEACRTRQLDVVKFLIDKGANVNSVDSDNISCLMLATFDDKIVKVLLKNGAKVDMQSNNKDTAMHIAAERNNIKSVKLLLKFNAQQLKNNQSLTPVLIAANKAHFGLVKYLIQRLHLPREEIIEAMELLGASCILKLDMTSHNLGFESLLKAFDMRSNSVITKKICEPVEAYNNHEECKTKEELLNIIDNFDALHCESFTIKERILGRTNKDMILTLKWVGVYYSHIKNYEACLKYWNRALEIALCLETSITFINFIIQVFSKMIMANITIDLLYIKNVLKQTTQNIIICQKEILNPSTKCSIKESYYRNIYMAIEIIIIIGAVLPSEHMIQYCEDPLVGDIFKGVVKLVKLDLKIGRQETLLHACVNPFTTLENISHTSNTQQVPNLSAVKLLIFCGANVNAVDYDNNTPLHTIGNNIHLIEGYQFLFPNIYQNNWREIVKVFLDSGAHSDYVNNEEDCPHTGYLKTELIVPNTPLSLKCLSARVLKNECPRILYNDVQKDLKEFINLH